MPSVRDRGVEQENAEAPVSDLMKRLASDGSRWAKAEVELASAEATSAFRSAISGLVAGLAFFAAMLVTLVILAQAAVQYLARYLENEGLASLLVAGGLLILSIVLGLVAWRLLKSAPETITIGKRLSRVFERTQQKWP